MDGPSDRYATIARFYDTVIEPMNAPLGRHALEMSRPPRGGTVLDVGCGTGIHLQAFGEWGARCFGVDLSARMLDRARSRLGSAAHLSIANAEAIPHHSRAFDVVIGSLLLHELPPDSCAAVLGEMMRVVAPEGQVLVIDYRAGRLRGKGRVWRMLTSIIERLAGADHYRQWRSYLARGGLPAMLPPGAWIEEERVVAGGNLALWLVRPHRRVDGAAST